MTPWIDIAAKYLGQRESLGPNDSPFIRRMLAKLNVSWLLGQPWCGVFAAQVMSESGLTYPKAYYRAASWATWGSALARPVFGCVVVMQRRGGGHVGFVIGQTTNGDLIVRGGNQGDAVRDSVFNQERAGGYIYRWPSGWTVPDQLTLPLSDAPKSVSEA